MAFHRLVALIRGDVSKPKLLKYQVADVEGGSIPVDRVFSAGDQEMILPSYEATVVANLDEVQKEAVVASAMASMRKHHPRFRIEHQNGSMAVLRYGLNWASYGERITIESEPGSIRIVSKCIFPLQLIDWGKNRWNALTVRHFLVAAVNQLYEKGSA